MDDVTVIEIAIEPKHTADGARLIESLAGLAEADPRFRFDHDVESGQIVIKGISEHQLDEKIQALLDLGLALNIGAPQVSYRETIARAVMVDYTHKRQERWADGRGEFARVKLMVEPRPGHGSLFGRATDASLPEDYVRGVEQGCEAALQCGPLGGFPVIAVGARLIDGAYHEQDSSTKAFETAARCAMREALTKGGPLLLEPIMRVRIVTPPDCVHAIMQGLEALRGQILGQEEDGSDIVIDAEAPCANLFGYASSLATASRKRATCEVRFGRYAPLPGSPDDGPFPPAVGMRA